MLNGRDISWVWHNTPGEQNVSCSSVKAQKLDLLFCLLLGFINSGP